MRACSRRESDVRRARPGSARASAGRAGRLWTSGRAAGTRGSAGFSYTPWASGRATGLVVGF
jgi:hypothetical protein